jgi:hypothetical protein
MRAAKWITLMAVVSLPAVGLADDLDPAAVNRSAGLAVAAVGGEHSAGGHWLASFATYLVTGKGR